MIIKDSNKTSKRNSSKLYPLTLQAGPVG